MEKVQNSRSRWFSLPSLSIVGSLSQRAGAISGIFTGLTRYFEGNEEIYRQKAALLNKGHGKQLAQCHYFIESPALPSETLNKGIEHRYSAFSGDPEVEQSSEQLALQLVQAMERLGATSEEMNGAFEMADLAQGLDLNQRFQREYPGEDIAPSSLIGMSGPPSPMSEESGSDEGLDLSLDPDFLQESLHQLNGSISPRTFACKIRRNGEGGGLVIEAQRNLRIRGEGGEDRYVQARILLDCSTHEIVSISFSAISDTPISITFGNNEQTQPFQPAYHAAIGEGAPSGAATREEYHSRLRAAGPVTSLQWVIREPISRVWHLDGAQPTIEKRERDFERRERAYQADGSRSNWCVKVGEREEELGVDLEALETCLQRSFGQTALLQLKRIYSQSIGNEGNLKSAISRFANMDLQMQVFADILDDECPGHIRELCRNGYLHQKNTIYTDRQGSLFLECAQRFALHERDQLLGFIETKTTVDLETGCAVTTVSELKPLSQVKGK